MARLEFAPAVFDDFDRFLDHTAAFDIADAPARIAGLIQAFDVLTHSPLIGRKVRDGRRGLVIGRAAQADVALYRYVSAIDTVFVLAVRSGREAGYWGDS